MRTLLFVLAFAIPAALASPVEAQGPEWIGTWTLSLDKSVYNPGPPPYVRGRMRILQAGDRLTFVYDLVRPRGIRQHMEWTGRFDGMDYAVQGVDEVITYSYKALDERTFEVLTKVDGRLAAVSRITLSQDGTTLTTVTGGRNARGEDITNTTVYEKVR